MLSKYISTFHPLSLSLSLFTWETKCPHVFLERYMAILILVRPLQLFLNFPLVVAVLHTLQPGNHFTAVYKTISVCVNTSN